MQTEFLNIRHLLALHEVIATRRIALAAGRVHLSQPAVTQAIARLERDLGARLFERRATGMFPTQAGEMFGRRVARMLDFLKTGEAQALRKSPRPGRARRAGFHRLVSAVQLRCLIAVADAGSFSQAARRLGVSQPAVQRAARDLESLTGLELFEPVRRGIALSPAAEALARNARLAAAEIRQGRYEIGAHLGRDSTRISIGTLPLSRTALLPGAIDAMLRASPGRVQVHCVDGPYERLLRELRHGELDFILGALREPSPADDVEQEKLFSDALSVVASVDHPLAGREGLTLQDTLDYPWIAPPKSTPSGSFLFERLGIPGLADTPVRIVSSSLVMARGLMLRGDYITIMSRRQYAVEESLGLLAALPIALEHSERPIGLTFRRDWMATPSQARLLGLIRARAAAPGDLPPRATRR
ncbi:MAG: LysR family transcriptional regulator [Jhaorihella sp.]